MHKRTEADNGSSNGITTPKLDRLLTVEEVAAALRVSVQTVYNGVAKRSKHPFPIRPKRVGRLLRFRASDVAAYLENQ